MLVATCTMPTYRLTVANTTRDLPICAASPDVSIAAFVIFGDVELTVNCAAALLAIAPSFDYMISPEAKSIPLIHEMARQSGINKYILARKSPKVYMRDVIVADVHSITSSLPQKLYLDTADADLM